MDQRRLRAGPGPGCGRPLLPVDPQSARQNNQCGVVPRTVRMVERSDCQLAASATTPQGDAAFIPTGFVLDRPPPASPQEAGQKSVGPYLRAIRVSPEYCYASLY